MNRLLARPSRASLLRLLASVGLALILWAWVTTLRDPETTRSFSAVPVTPTNLDDSLVIVNSTGEAQVRITGPESIVDGVSSGQIQAILDLEDIDDPGTYSLDVIVDAPEDVWRTQSQPSSVGVTVEAAVAEEFPLEIAVQDLDESSLRTVTVEPDVDKVVARGPSSAIDRIAAYEECLLDGVVKTVDILKILSIQFDIDTARNSDAVKAGFADRLR